MTTAMTNPSGTPATTVMAPPSITPASWPGSAIPAHRKPPGPGVETGPRVCHHDLSGLPCVNAMPHAGGGRGCVHMSTSGVPDRHDYGDDE